MLARRLAVDPLQRVSQLVDTPRSRKPFGDPHEVVEQPVESILDGNEGGGDLHHATERHLARQVFWRGEQQRNHWNQCSAAIGDPGQPTALTDHGEPAPDEAVIGACDRAAFTRLGARQRDGLAMVADPHQRKAQPRLGLVARRDQARQSPADDGDEERHQDGVEDRRQHQIGRHNQDGAANLQGQRSADLPKDLDEGDDGDDRREQADGEVDHRLRRPAHIVGNAIFRIAGS